ncbi:unnamed protein product [Moneuplotes crassus]|uniref:Transporter n=1 Tax=Euplotes crassus TaxID=5936 RepID=A0AAD1X9K0_EUPCR|nr:unnamed protein product [Moneuplotes crassus]
MSEGRNTCPRLYMNQFESSISAKSSYAQHLHSYEESRMTKAEDKTNSRYTNQIQFWLSCLGYAVGYGNIWRFPYMLYKNGGGVFLVPYAICVVIIVLPLSYLEISYGQIFRRAIHRYYDLIHPRLIGLSFGISSIIFFIAVYYMCLVAWCFTFLLYSFQDPLPWAPKEGESAHEALTSDGYFVKEFLGKSKSMFDIESYNPMIMVSFTVVSLITYFTVYKGLDTAKYVVYLTVPLPYFLLTVLFFKGITLDGFTLGWTYLFKPDWSKLFTFGIWGDAASQVLFSSGLAQNTIVTIAAHRNDRDPMFWSTVLIPIMNFSTSIFASLALFSFIGYASYSSGIPVGELPVRGMDLTFVAYPALINSLPFPQIWSIMFFIMLTTLGLSCQYMFLQCISQLIIGTLNRTKSIRINPKIITICVALVMFIVDIGLFSSSAGYYWVEYVDQYATGINLVLFLFFQLATLVYILPLSKLAKRVSRFGEKFPKMYYFPLRIICPGFALVLAISAIWH